ncbi:uncharacterized protein [Tiliqua scincoides]|uniref:uncharacterized protein n=1 Tax=Tiliqua scincoides TaxID=71010 RepID=UPI0034624DAC
MAGTTTPVAPRAHGRGGGGGQVAWWEGARACWLLPASGSARSSIMREGLLGWPGAAAAAAAGRPSGHALGTMDLVAGMEVGAEIEVTEDGVPEELPLHLENAKNCLSWESLDVSSSDDDGEAYFTFCLPVRRPPRPAQRPAAQRQPASPATVKPPSCEKRIPPLYPCPLRPSVPAEPEIPTFEAYQCQQCLQVFMEEWHYSQHLQDHLQEETQQRVVQLQTRSHSQPCKLRCLECGKRFLHPEHFARHTKWHLKLLRKGIKVCHKKGSRRATQVSYVYKPLDTAENQLGTKDTSGLLVTQENSRQPKSLQSPRLQRGGKRKALRHPKRTPTIASQGLQSPTYSENSVAILDGEGSVSLLQPWPKKQETILEDQATAGLFQPAVISAENQIIILGDDEAEDRPVVSEHHYTEVQATILDGQVSMNAVRPLFLRAEEQAAILDAQVNMSSLQLSGVKEQAAVSPGWVGQNPCTVFRTVLLQAEEQATILDGQVESNPLQQVIIKTSEVSPTLYLDTEPHLSSLDSATLHFVPLHQEPQYVTLPYGNSLALDHTETLEEGDKAWESQATTLQLPGYLPNIYQQGKQPSPTATTSPSPKAPLVVRLVPCASGEHPEVLDLEYDMGGGIPVASEPWEASVGTGQETYNTEEATEDNFIVVEVETDPCSQGLAADYTHDTSREQTLPGIIIPKTKSRVRRFKCPDCGVCYSRMSQLRSHQKGPKRQGRRYLCECGASFYGLLHLLRHQLQHLEEALFTCATCGKSLKGHKVLARHSSCHPGPARFGCRCGISFQRLSRYLWHHVRSQQPSLRVYTLSDFLLAG